MAHTGYPDGSYGGYVHSNPPLSSNSSLNAGQTGSGGGASVEESSSTLDHALLESLFYNEMMMLDASSPSPSSFLNQHFNEVQHSSASVPAASDPNTIAEKEMLQDFGVDESSIQLHHPPAHHPHTTSENWRMPPASNAMTTGPVPTTSAPLAPPIQSTHAPIRPALTPIAPAPPLPPQHPVPLPPVVASGPPPAVAIAPKPKLELSIDASHPPEAAPVPHDRAKQLVDQFATLASRLGISLPDSVLQSLTTAAAKNDPQTALSTISKSVNLSASMPRSQGSQNSLMAGSATSSPAEAPATAGASTTPTAGSTSQATKAGEAEKGQSHAVAPTVQELRKTAEEAIAAVTRKRQASQEELSPSFQTNGNGAAGGKPMYSKRRKKPRLADCESRLAELQAENELLKRHLQTISNKAHQLNKEKEEAGLRIQRLHEENAGPEEMNTAVQEFTDMYSDYGVNRQQELSFHLEQLQRLVNPTNFTKMGLWTLGQNSLSSNRNPIAGILQKELDITPQQGRKILEQSEKVRALCGNLKECIALLHKLKTLCEQKTKIFHDRINKCREILTSKQVVKLILWINEHTEVLEKVCPGWGTEHIHPTASKHT